MNGNLFNEATYFSYGFRRNPATGFESTFDNLTTFVYIKSGSFVVDFFDENKKVVVNAGEMIYLPILKRRILDFVNEEDVVGQVFCFRYQSSMPSIALRSSSETMHSNFSPQAGQIRSSGSMLSSKQIVSPQEGQSTSK